MKIRDDGEIQALVARATAGARDEDAALRSFLDLLREHITFPLDAQVVGVSVEVQNLRYDGNPRRGLLAMMRRNGRPYEVALEDVWVDSATLAGRALAAYRAWVGTPPMVEAPPALPAPLLTDWEDVRSAESLEVVVLAARQEVARVRVPTTGEELILRSGFAAEAIPGETLTVVPRKSGTWRQHRILSGDVLARRLDIPLLGLTPLALRDRGQWDPSEEYRGAPGRPIPPYYVPIIQVGPRPSFEMENPLSSCTPEDDPILAAIHQREDGDEDRAIHVLMDTLARDLRTLDAHAWLGTFRFRDDPRRALAHWRVGLTIGELSVSPRFAGVLPWSSADNRPFLRCLFGCGLASWRLGQVDVASRLLDRLLWLNPGDAQGARHILARIRDGRPWSGERSEVA